MTTLHDRLADLADDAPPGGPVPDLWDRGRRYHRRRRAGTALIAVVVVLALAGLGTLDWWRARPSPVPADSTPALPSKLWSPNVWLPGTDDAGPPGQLAAVQETYRGSWTGREDGVVGVSATTGEYRFLDLPSQAPGGIALAPDGRHVAYWYTGETEQSPDSDSGPVVGVAVYDTTTGEVSRHAVPTDHGLSVQDLAWADGERLVFSYYQYAGGDADDEKFQGMGTAGDGLLLWDVDSGEDVTPLGDLGEVESSTGTGQLLLSEGPWSWLDVDHPSDRIAFRLPSRPGLMYVSAANASGTRVAWPSGSRNPNKVLVGSIDGRRVDAVEVPGSGRTFRVRAWLDEHRIAIDQRAGKGYDKTALRILDVRTGESEELLRYPRGSWGGSVDLATDLLSVPSADRPKPPDPVSPRKIAAGTVVVGLGGIVALLWWRRRVRP